MPLSQCMQAHTNRQFLAWLVYLEEEHNRPSRSDYYMMGVACEVRAIHMSLAGKKAAPKLDDLKIKFSTGSSKASQNKKPLSEEEAMALAKVSWAGLLAQARTIGDTNNSKNG